MNITTKATPQDNTTAAKVAQAAQRYARRASSMAPSVGGIGAAALAGGVGAIANRSSLSSEAARELLREHQGKLGVVMESVLRSAAGPVR